MHAIKPFILRGLGYKHIFNFDFSLKSYFTNVISVLERFYFKKRMGDHSRPTSGVSSCRMSVFSEDDHDRRIPIVTQQDSQEKHLAVRAEEWDDESVREGIYTATLMCIMTMGNESSGGKLNSTETVKKELGKVIGEETGYLWMGVDVKEWYHALKQKTFKHAFISPYEAMEMLMIANDEKEPRFQIRPGQAGKIGKMYPTLNIMKDAAREQISYQLRKNEKDDGDEEQLLEIYASRLTRPTCAYLRGDGFKGEFQENGLLNAYTEEALKSCIYAGVKGTTEEINERFICKVKLCPCRQMMRYVMGNVSVPNTGFWNSEKVVLKIHLVALQRDVLTERRDRIRFDPSKMEEKSEELMEIRMQLQMVDSQWSKCRVRGRINVKQRPLITANEWRKMIFMQIIENDWDSWNEKESSEQWHALERIGSLREAGTLRPAPGVAEEGSDEDAYRVEEYLGGRFEKLDLQIPVPPPSTNEKAGPSQAPYDVMPQGSDPYSQGSEERKTKKIPDKPSTPKPGPPKAPEIVRKASQESENLKKTEEVKVAPVSLTDQSRTIEDKVWLEEGVQVLGFGHFTNYTYRELWSWICSGTLTVSGILQGCNGVDKKAMKFLNWMNRLQQEIDKREEA